MANKLSKLRHQAMQDQDGCCCYCKQPMWLKDKAGFCRRHRLSSKQAQQRQCTSIESLDRAHCGSSLRVQRMTVHGTKD